MVVVWLFKKPVVCRNFVIELVSIALMHKRWVIQSFKDSDKVEGLEKGTGCPLLLFQLFWSIGK